MRTTPLSLLLLALAVVGCHRSEAPAGGPQIATTTSYLEAAARDLLGDNLSVVRLAEPGTCPGHFDIRPSQVAELRQCRALLRFDFQNIARRQTRRGGHQPTARRASLASGGMCRPDSYLAACRQIADHLVSLDLLARTDADTRLQAIASRHDALSRDATNGVTRAACRQ